MPAQKERERMIGHSEKENKRWMWAAVGVMLVVWLIGASAILTVTGYESRKTVEFHEAGRANGFIFIVHLRADGPFSTYKDATVLNVQVLGTPVGDTRMLSLGLFGDEALWSINVTRSVDYPAGVPLPSSTFFEASDARGRLVFTEDGLQKMRAVLWTDSGGNVALDGYGTSNGTVTVDPKDSDVLWRGTQVSALGVVIGVGVYVGLEGVKDLRDLRHGSH